MNRPLVVLTAFYIAGILLGGFTTIKASAALIAAAFCFFAVLAGCFLVWKGNRLLLLALFLFLGLALSRLAVEASETPLVDFSGRRVTLAGRVAAEPDVREDKVFYLFEAKEIITAGGRQEIYGTVRLSAADSDRIYSYSDIIKVTGLIALPESAGNPGGFDYRTYLERQGIRAVLMARGTDAVQVIGRGTANPVLKTVLALKQKLVKASVTSLPTSQARIMSGIIFGIQGPIDRETRRSFSETGLVHILSVSGLHVGLVLGAIIILLFVLGVSPRLTAPLATPVLISYALMTGFNPAVMRATIMALLLLWGHHLGRDRDWPTTMAAAALVLLLWKPLQIYHPGFQLSFAATWGILYLGPALCTALRNFLKGFSPAVTTTVSSMLAVPLAAQLATVPLVAWYYNFISPVSVPANLLAVPLVGLIMILGILAAVLGLVWPPLAGLANAGTSVLLDLFLWLVNFFQGLPGAVVYLAAPPVLLAAVWYAGLFTVVRLHGCGADVQKRLKGWAVAAAFFSVVLLLIIWPVKGRGELTVHFLDVGQGDCILVQTPEGKNTLIDTGGRPGETGGGGGVGDQVVAPYLRRIGVNRIDVLVLTHPHDDHCGGAFFLVKSFPVALTVIPPGYEEPAGDKKSFAGGEAVSRPGSTGNYGDETSTGYPALMEEIKALDIPVRTAFSGDKLILERGVEIEILSPEKLANEMGGDANNSSLVLKLTYGCRSFLFTGDIEKEAQEILERRGEELKADVLKVPHHGSSSVTGKFLKLVKPAEAVISVGAHNTFGHPAQSTLDMLKQAGSRIYRTDLDGAVIVETDGDKIEISTGKN